MIPSVMEVWAACADTILQDRNHDGITDYINARIYVADDAAPDELAAAANIAARLAFETLSMDLPIGLQLSAYSDSDTAVAILVGRAAIGFEGDRDGARQIIPIPSVRDAEYLARMLGSARRQGPDSLSPPSFLSKQLSLATLFGVHGLLGDPDGDLIPERIETTLVLGPDVHAPEVIDLAARLALEATGVHLPLAVLAPDDVLPQNSILIGRSNPWIQRLIESNHFQPDAGPGHGQITVIDRCFGNNTVLVITGADAEGEAEAIRHAAQRLPYAWEYGKDRLCLSRIETDIRRFFALRSPEGQATAALYRARQAAVQFEGKDLESARLQVLVDGDCPAYLDYLQKQFPDLDVEAANLEVRPGPLIFEDTYQLTWEGRDARHQIEEFVIPQIRAGSDVKLELRVSESPQVRADLGEEIRQLLLQHGSDPAGTSVRILSAYKQGYHWIDEQLKPLLGGAARIRIFFKRAQPLDEAIIESPIRWLQELYPIDEVLARDLGIAIDDVTFHEIEEGSKHIYRVEAEDAAGQSILQKSFDPRFVLRPMFDRFPDYATVRVTTGWLSTTIGSKTVADGRIKTDPEQFWDQYQDKTLPKIHDYLVQLAEGPPQARCAPLFDALEVELWLSEPDDRIGIDEERISSLEALHEDIYFETLLFFDLMGLAYPGRIIPRIHSGPDGHDGVVRIRFTGKAGPNPRVDLRWKEHGKSESRHTEELWPVAIESPRIVGLTVRAGHPRVVSLDCTLPASGDAGNMIAAMRELHDHGVGLTWLSYEGIDALRFGLTELPATEKPYQLPRIQASTTEMGSIVQWETPISPSECKELIGQLARFPEVRPFHAGTSYLGHSIWALDVMAPLSGKYFSQAKASVTKPVLFITGRQHANEVSSTSHILKLVEQLATDPMTRKLLDRVNFIIHPITNPDGAALVDELQRTTPDWMLHAGYLGALGMDVTLEQWAQDPRYPEAMVRRELWQMWLPDVVLNPHGYPSHEWVQLFAGYTAWVRSRTINARDWWIPRGWFIPGFDYIEDATFPEHRKTAFALRDRMATAVHSVLGPWNQRMYRRYAKYGEWDPDTYQTQLHNGVLIYSQDEGSKPNPQAQSFMERYPQVTVLEIVSEAPDETARGEWLKVVAAAGLAFSLATAAFLAESDYAVQTSVRHDAEKTELRMRRKRPVLPPEE